MRKMKLKTERKKGRKNMRETAKERKKISVKCDKIKKGKN